MKTRLLTFAVLAFCARQLLSEEFSAQGKLDEISFHAKVEILQVHGSTALARVLEFRGETEKSNVASYGSVPSDEIVVEFVGGLLNAIGPPEVGGGLTTPDVYWVGFYRYTTVNGDTRTVKRYASHPWEAEKCIERGQLGSVVTQTPRAERGSPPPPRRPPAPAPATIFTGTGWFCNGGYVVTCNHVIDGKSKITVRWPSISGVPAEVVVRDKANDIAVLKPLQSGALPPGLPMSKTSPRQGERVFTIGFPHPDVQGAAAKVTDGIVNSLSGLGDDPRIMQIQVPVQAGNSGGPLVNLNGEVVGIVVAKVNAVLVFALTGDLPENINFAVKSQYIEPLITGLQALPNAQGLSAGGDSLENIVARIKASIVLVTAE